MRSRPESQFTESLFVHVCMCVCVNFCLLCLLPDFMSLHSFVGIALDAFNALADIALVPVLQSGNTTGTSTTVTNSTSVNANNNNTTVNANASASNTTAVQNVTLSRVLDYAPELTLFVPQSSSLKGLINALPPRMLGKMAQMALKKRMKQNQQQWQQSPSRSHMQSSQLEQQENLSDNSNSPQQLSTSLNSLSDGFAPLPYRPPIPRRPVPVPVGHRPPVPVPVPANDDDDEDTYIIIQQQSPMEKKQKQIDQSQYDMRQDDEIDEQEQHLMDDSASFNDMEDDEQVDLTEDNIDTTPLNKQTHRRRSLSHSSLSFFRSPQQSNETVTNTTAPSNATVPVTPVIPPPPSSNEETIPTNTTNTNTTKPQPPTPSGPTRHPHRPRPYHPTPYRPSPYYPYPYPYYEEEEQPEEPEGPSNGNGDEQGSEEEGDQQYPYDQYPPVWRPMPMPFPWSGGPRSPFPRPPGPPFLNQQAIRGGRAESAQIAELVSALKELNGSMPFSLSQWCEQNLNQPQAVMRGSTQEQLLYQIGQLCCRIQRHWQAGVVTLIVDSLRVFCV
jgi:hypothetical protein